MYLRFRQRLLAPTPNVLSLKPKHSNATTCQLGPLCAKRISTLKLDSQKASKNLIHKQHRATCFWDSMDNADNRKLLVPKYSTCCRWEADRRFHAQITLDSEACRIERNTITACYSQLPNRPNNLAFCKVPSAAFPVAGCLRPRMQVFSVCLWHSIQGNWPNSTPWSAQQAAEELCLSRSII